MKSIIKGIFECTVDPAREIISQDPAYSRLWSEINKEEDCLLEQISPEARERYANMQKLVSDAFCMDIYAGYAYGVRLGFQLCLDILEPKHPCD